MIIKCRDCNEPMNESRKGRPDGLQESARWYVCRECEKGVEIDGELAIPEDMGKVSSLRYTEKVTAYIEIVKVGNKVFKKIYGDKDYKKKISEEIISG